MFTGQKEFIHPFTKCCLNVYCVPMNRTDKNPCFLMSLNYRRRHAISKNIIEKKYVKSCQVTKIMKKTLKQGREQRVWGTTFKC